MEAKTAATERHPEFVEPCDELVDLFRLDVVLACIPQRRGDLRLVRPLHRRDHAIDDACALKLFLASLLEQAPRFDDAGLSEPGRNS